MEILLLFIYIVLTASYFLPAFHTYLPSDWTGQKPGRDSVIAKVKELLKDHHDLLLGFNVFLSAEAKIVIPSEAKKAEYLAKSADTEKKHADAEDFMNKLKTRSRTLDTHVVGSFKAIMRMFKEGKMSVKEVHKEVTDILYYHEDLINDFLRFFEKNDPIASASLLLEL
ncbi:unnamed protein product [Arabidopsis halleri]